MSFTVLPSHQFLKAIKKYSKSGRKNIVRAAEEIIDLLAIHDDRSLFVLASRWKDHALKGNKKGIRELHLGFDDLLLYAINEESAVIILIDIVNHEELRRS